MKNKRFTAGELSALCLELYEVWHAGLPLADGLYALCGEGTDGNNTLRQMYHVAEDGANLPDALRAVGGFPAYMVEMLTLAEKTGKQEETLRALSEYYDRTDRLLANIRSAVFYPAILAVIMLVVVVVLATEVLPVFEGVFEQLGMHLSGVAGVLLRTGQGLSSVAVVVGGVLAVIVVAALAVRMVPAARVAVSGAFRRIFGGRGIGARIATTRFLAAMAMASQSGMDTEQAIGYAANICSDDPRTQAKIEQCRTQLENGAKVGEAMEGLLSPRNCRMITLSERTGSQAEVFAEVAKRSERAVDDELDRMIGWVEPALVILTAAVVGVILLSIMLPLLGIMSAV